MRAKVRAVDIFVGGWVEEAVVHPGPCSPAGPLCLGGACCAAVWQPLGLILVTGGIVAQAAKGKTAAKTVTKTVTHAAAVKPASRSHPPKELKEPVLELKDEYIPT